MVLTILWYEQIIHHTQSHLCPNTQYFSKNILLAKCIVDKPRFVMFSLPFLV